MEIRDRLTILQNSARFDVCGYHGVRSLDPRRFIYRSSLPGGGKASLFKVLLTNICTSDCAYCVNRIGRDIPRTAFQPEELARVFMELYRKRMVRGLFLSSGLGVNPTQTMTRMVETVAILRQRHQFSGYIHLKMLPGASHDCVEAGCRLASRVSVNIEAPTVQHLARLSRRKKLWDGILEPMRWVRELKNADDKLVPSGQTTQYVVGAAGETDQDILHTTGALYREIGLQRVYFSPFHPIRNSPLEEVPPASPWRAHRLYQADWLLRVYGFAPQEVELALGEKGNLSLGKDPKLVIAEKQPWLFPVDINRASYEELLRVPGIGPVSAQRIVASRGEHSIFSMAQLRKLGVATRRAAPCIWFQGMLPAERQVSFIPRLEDAAEVPSLVAAVA